MLIIFTANKQPQSQANGTVWKWNAGTFVLDRGAAFQTAVQCAYDDIWSSEPGVGTAIDLSAQVALGISVVHIHYTANSRKLICVASDRAFFSGESAFQYEISLYDDLPKSTVVPRMRIAILDDYVNAAREAADWTKLDRHHEIEISTNSFPSEQHAADALADFEIVVGMRERTPFPASLIGRLPKLKLLITTGMRNASFDLDAARKNGITVCGTRAQSASTAELAVGLMIAVMRDIPGQSRSMRDGNWQTWAGRDLAGKNIGLLGLGKLGGAVALVAHALGMNVLAWSQNLTSERAHECNTRLVDKDELFRLSDVISIHLVLSSRTEGLVGARELGLMKPTAYIINTSRGPIVAEDALIDALQRKKIAGAAIDVYDAEPLPADHPLRRLDNILLTPHIGYVTQENLALMYQDAVENIEAYFSGQPQRVLT